MYYLEHEPYVFLEQTVLVLLSQTPIFLANLMEILESGRRFDIQKSFAFQIFHLWNPLFVHLITFMRYMKEKRVVRLSGNQ